MLQSSLPVRYCKAANGMSLAWASLGEGPPLVLASMIFALDHAFAGDSPFQFFLDIARDHQLIVYDGLGSGLSERSFTDISVEHSVTDLSCVVDAAGLDRFSLISATPGTQVSLQYAAQHPERVDRLIVVGGPARGLAHRDSSPEQITQREAILAAIEAGWDLDIPAFRLLNSLSCQPDAPPKDQEFMAEWFHLMIGASGFSQFIRSSSETDVSAFASEIKCPALIFCARDAVRIPFEECRRLASLIPNGQLVPLQGRNAFPLRTDAEYAIFVATARRFLTQQSERESSSPRRWGLTPREQDILELVAKGLDNSQIAKQLGVSEKTVRNNITPIFQKLDVTSRARAIVLAHQSGIGLD